jgi:hypothetical protein
MAQAFVDESGRFVDPNDTVVVIAVVGLAEPIRLRRLIAQVRRSLPKKAKYRKERRLSEIKFQNVSQSTRVKLLRELASENVKIAVLVVEKGGKSIEDTPTNYARLLREILPKCVKAIPDLDAIVLDHHFHSRAEEEFTALLRTFLPHSVRIQHADSLQDSRVDLADFVAGAVNQYERLRDSTYIELVRSRIILYESRHWKEIKKW